MSEASPAVFERPSLGQRLRDHVDEVGRSQPARLALGVFALVIGVAAALLSLPMATTSGRRAPFADALFTAASAVCVTGLTTVDTGSYWSGFGQAVIIIAIKIGGLGVITIASLLGLAVSRRIGLTGRLLAQRETKTDKLGEVGTMLKFVFTLSTSLEAVLTLILLPRFITHEETWPNALWHAVFYAISSVNSAGFTSHPGGLPSYAAGDWWLCLPIAIGVFVGGLGFPVLVTVGKLWRTPTRWSLHTKLTLAATTVLFALSVLMFAGFEWTNERTLGAMPWSDRLLNVIFLAVMPRSGGFSLIPMSQLHAQTWLGTDVLMFIGGGSASTAGGIKVSTVAVLFLATAAEARGDSDAEAFGRRIPSSTLRLAVTVLAAGATMCVGAVMVLLSITNAQLDVVTFEVVSAFSTCGLSLGLTPDLPAAGKYVLVALMFLGRTGTMTLAAALALRERPRLFRLAEERPIVG